MNYRGIFKEHASTLTAAFHVVDWLVIALSSIFAHWIYLDAPDVSGRYTVAILIALLCAAWLFPRFSLYQAWRGGSLFDEIRSLSVAWGSVLLALTVFAFTTKMGAEYSRGWFAIWALSGWTGLIIARVLLRGGLRWLRQRGFNQRHIVIVGRAGLGDLVAQRLKAAPWMGLNIVGFFHDEKDDNEQRIEGLPQGGTLDDVAQYVREHEVDQVWIAMPLRDEDKVQKLLHDLRHSTVDIRLVPDLFGLRLINHSVMDVAGLPVVNLSVSPMAGLNLWVKAIEDRFLALSILLLISPVMLFLAIGVKLSSPGPVFYRQERVGWNGSTFSMLKFRSMLADAEKEGIRWGGAQGKTTTRFGNFIRKTSLDELPQFINVLRGDMAIVGPRPERPMFVEQFKDEIPDYMKKHMVKAGITGWAQINGWRGDTDLSKRIECDLYYIENWSLWFDLKIIFLTLFKGFVHKNAR